MASQLEGSSGYADWLEVRRRRVPQDLTPTSAARQVGGLRSVARIASAMRPPFGQWGHLECRNSYGFSETIRWA